MYTVKQLSDLAGVSIRTLHYYHEFGLLAPSTVGDNGYRYYDDAAVLRLQQILFYREIGLELAHIKDILDQPHFDLAAALTSHRAALTSKITRLQQLVSTVDHTIDRIQQENNIMGKKDKDKKDKKDKKGKDDKQLFKGFSKEQQKEYEREARLQYGADNVNESVARWESYSKKKQADIMAEAGDIYTDFVTAMQSGLQAGDPQVNAIAARWHENMRYFYEPTIEIMRGLAETYKNDPAFRKTFDQFHTDLADYLHPAITGYVDALETQQIARLLAADDMNSAHS